MCMIKKLLAPKRLSSRNVFLFPVVASVANGIIPNNGKEEYKYRDANGRWTPKKFKKLVYAMFMLS